MATNLATAKRKGKVNVQEKRNPLKPGNSGGSRKVYPTGHAKEALNANLPESTLTKAQGRVPTPTNVNQPGVSAGNQGEVSYEQASQNLATGGLTGDVLKQAQAGLAAKYGVTGGAEAPVATPAAAPTPTQNRYQTGLAAAKAAGVEAPADAGVARATASSYLPAQAKDTSVVDNIFSQDPVIGQLMGGIAELLSSKNQVPSIMDDYKKLRRQSGLDDINEELIDAETILDGSEDDIRNEIQVAGGIGTESQVQAMTLSRNKNLLKRYNQLVQMKTDATNQLNTMLTLTQQDRQMAQERVNTQISAMFNMANFRQTALQNTRQQQQFMIQTLGPDGYYATVSKDPRQLAMAEQIGGWSPGGLQAAAAQATAEKVRKANLEERQIRATESNAALGWASLAETKRHNAAVETSANTAINLGGGTSLTPYAELSADQVNKVREAVQAKNLLKQMEELYYSSELASPKRASGLAGRLQGIGASLRAAAGGYQPTKTYQNFVESNLSTIAKGMKSESGTLTNQDVGRARKTIPTAISTRTEAEAAFAEAYRQVDETLGTFGQVVVNLD